MPILSLQKDRAPQFPCIGKLRKGGAKRVNRQGKEIMGVDLNHFRLTTDDAAAAAAFAAYYGNEPKAIEVFMPYATTNENFGAWLEEYTAGGMTRRCDGETQHFHRDATGKGDTTPIRCERLAGRACGCKQVGRLAVIVPQLARLAYITVETHSLYDIMQLTENLQAAEALRGDLRGIPFVLSRREREISTPGDNGKRARRSKSLLFIEPNPKWVALQLESMRLAALPIVDTPALQAPPMRQIVGPTDSSSGETDVSYEDALGDVLDELDTLGEIYYGNKWEAELRRLVAFASNNVTEDASRLPLEAIEKLIVGLTRRIEDRSQKTASPTAPAKASNDQVRDIEVQAQRIYGDQWFTHIERLAQDASSGAAKTFADLTPKEADALLATLTAAPAGQPAGDDAELWK